MITLTGTVTCALSHHHHHVSQTKHHHYRCQQAYNKSSRITTEVNALPYVCVVDRARNVELIESRPEIPRQIYQHAGHRNTSWNKSASLDHCNALSAGQQTATASQYAARQTPSQYTGSGFLSGQYSIPPPGGSVTSTNWRTPSSTLHSQTSSKNSASSQARTVPSYKTSQSSLGSSAAGSLCRTDFSSAEHIRSEHTVTARYHDTTRTTSHGTSSTDQQLLPVHHGQLIDGLILFIDLLYCKGNRKTRPVTAM